MLHALPLLLLLATASDACPDAPAKALRAHVVFQGRLRPSSTTGSRILSFAVERHLKGPPLLTSPSGVVRVVMGVGGGRCSGSLPLVPRRRYIVFATSVGGRLVSTAHPEPASQRRAVRKVLCKDCARAPRVKWVQVQEQHVTAPLHSKLKLLCRLYGNPQPRVTWFKNGRRIRADHRRKLRVKKRLAHLIIHHVSLEDEGVYKCLARNALGNASATATVNTTTSVDPPWPENEPCPYCVNGGLCKYIPEIKEKSCECADGYWGARCQEKRPSLGNQTHQLWPEISHPPH